MILQSRLPYDLASARPLPNIGPVPLSEWLLTDDAHAGQMAERERLLTERRGEVLQLDPEALPVAQELLDQVLECLPGGYARGDTSVIRPDGVTVAIDRSDPLATVGRMIQEDVCLLEKRPGSAEHVLTGAVLCFPAGWRLASKMMRPLVAIHAPIPEYDEGLARRVQRLFDGVQPGRPLMRFNKLWYNEPTLFYPGPRRDNNDRDDPATAPYLRSERQCLMRLPRSGAVAFSIHTYLVPRALAMPAGDAAALVQ